MPTRGVRKGPPFLYDGMPRCRPGGLRGSRRLLQVGDKVGALLRVLHAGKGHLGALDELPGRGQELVERRLVPHHARAAHGVGVVVIIQAAGGAAEQSLMTRTNPVGVDGMAALATHIELLALGGIARSARGSRRQQRQSEQQQDRKSCHWNLATLTGSASRPAGGSCLRGGGGGHRLLEGKRRCRALAT